MKTHLTIIGTINISFGIVGSLCASVIFVVLYGFFPIDFGEFPARIVGIVVGGIIFFCSIILIVSGIGILKEASWARILILIISGMALFLFPGGTAWGIYSIIILTKQETVEIFYKKDSIKKGHIEAADKEKDDKKEEPPPPASYTE